MVAIDVFDVEPGECPLTESQRAEMAFSRLLSGEAGTISAIGDGATCGDMDYCVAVCGIARLDWPWNILKTDKGGVDFFGSMPTKTQISRP